MRLTRFIDEVRLLVHRRRLPPVDEIIAEEQREIRDAGWTPEQIDEMHRRVMDSPEAKEALEEALAEREKRRRNQPSGLSHRPQRPGDV